MGLGVISFLQITLRSAHGRICTGEQGSNARRYDEQIDVWHLSVLRHGPSRRLPAVCKPASVLGYRYNCENVITIRHVRYSRGPRL